MFYTVWVQGSARQPRSFGGPSVLLGFRVPAFLGNLGCFWGLGSRAQPIYSRPLAFCKFRVLGLLRVQVSSGLSSLVDSNED